jgi:type II secretory pathway pseudopilin PulG
MRRNKGQSMIEVLFAVFLVGVSASIVIASLPIATMSRTKADLSNKATGLAQKQLEAIRGLGYANATASQLAANGLIESDTPIEGNTYSFTNIDAAAHDNPALILPGGTGRVTLEQADIDLRRVIVRIDYLDRGQPRSIQLGTLIANL